ncbi:MAG: Fe-S-containing hydro-lyase [Clostridiales bacterium]|nr:Fe-S-containing hydro-lyase [Clostridiales bacterium]
MMIKITTPITEKTARSLRAGDIVLITGTIYTGRDAAHKRLCELLARGESLPIDVKNSVIYYVGPTPAKPGRAIGSAGPTSSYRMDPYAEPLLQQGLRVMVGKGSRGKEFKELLKKYGGVYLSAIGGAAASISETIKKCEVVTYEDLGAEAIHRLEVEDFYAIVTYDSEGNDLFEQGIEKYKKV